MHNVYIPIVDIICGTFNILGHLQILYYVPCSVSRTLHGTRYTHHNLKYMLPQHCITHNDVSLLIISSQVKCKLPEDGPNGPKHVEAIIRYFNVNFNILYV